MDLQKVGSLRSIFLNEILLVVSLLKEFIKINEEFEKIASAHSDIHCR